jgi:hypothetical protein
MHVCLPAVQQIWMLPTVVHVCAGEAASFPPASVELKACPLLAPADPPLVPLLLALPLLPPKPVVPLPLAPLLAPVEPPGPEPLAPLLLAPPGQRRRWPAPCLVRPSACAHTP